MVGLIVAAPLYAIGLDLYRELKAVGFFDEDEAPEGDGQVRAAPVTQSAASGEAPAQAGESEP